MAWIRDIKSKSRRAAAIMFTVATALGTIAGSASAQGWEHRDRQHNHWDGGYYRAPPVVYGRSHYPQPYYYSPPPVVYGPGIGLNFNIR